MTSYSVLVLTALTFSATVSFGRLEPVRYYGHGGPSVWSLMNGTAKTVGDIISFLEQSSPSSGAGVMVAVANWSLATTAAADDTPNTFLRTLQDRHEQPVYAANVDRLLADGLWVADTSNDSDDFAADGRAGNDNDTRNTVDRPLPAPCRQPPRATDRGRALLLPPRARYVVLFQRDHNSYFDDFIYLNHTFWTEDVHYLVVVHTFDHDARRTLYDVWHRLSIYKVIVVTPTVVKLFNPFVYNSTKGHFTNISLQSLKQIPQILRSRIKNLHRFPLRFVMHKRIPTVIEKCDGKYIGQDGSSSAVLAAKMNATPIYLHSELPESGKIFYGYNWTANKTYGTISGVLDGWADIASNGHFLKDYRCYSIEFTRHITSDTVCILSPKADVIPPMMTVLMSFQKEVWMMTAITYILVTLLYYAATALNTQWPGPTGCNLGLEIYKIFIGAPTNRTFTNSCQRILTSFSLIFSLVILNAFQGSLVTFLSTPMHYPDINSFKELEQSNLPIRTSSISFKDVLIGDPNLKALANRIEKWPKEKDIQDSDGRFAGFQRVNVFNLKHFKDVLLVSNNNTRALHTMNENSPYKRRINILLSWMDQAGLVLKWNRDVYKYIFDVYKPNNSKDDKISKVFSVRDLEIAFIVLSFGIILSIIVFNIEILYKKIYTTQPPNYPFLH